MMITIIYIMGSLPEDTLCSYCGVHEASYIPDGCCGPLCIGEWWDFEDGVPSCFECGPEISAYKRLFRFAASQFKVLSKSSEPDLPWSDIVMLNIIAKFLIYS